MDSGNVGGQLLMPSVGACEFSRSIDSGRVQYRTTDGKLAAGVALLAQARQFADEFGCDHWDFAVEIDELRRVGLTNNDFRWLVCNGYTEHAKEITPLGDDQRVFHPTGQLTFSPETCFVLTRKGAIFADQHSGDSSAVCPIPLAQASPKANGRPRRQKVIPHWDCDRREVRLSGRLVKRFKLPSPNQETVLTVFEEEGWPPRIDDPLPYDPRRDSKRRLHDTIRGLNRHQKDCRIRFQGDGTGEGILWELFGAIHSDDCGTNPNRHQTDGLSRS